MNTHRKYSDLSTKYIKTRDISNKKRGFNQKYLHLFVIHSHKKSKTRFFYISIEKLFNF